MVQEIQLTRGKVAIVDDEDFAMVSQFKWNAGCTADGVWYAKRRIPGNKSMKMHRFILGAQSGELVDHIDGDELNNTRANIRIATPRQNMHNRKSTQGSSTPFKGVFWERKSGRFRVQIKANGECLYLGLFEDVIDAALAYDSAARRIHGEFARLNFPTDESIRCARESNQIATSFIARIPKFKRLTDEVKRSAKELLTSGRSQESVARELGISPSSVWRIANGT